MSRPVLLFKERTPEDSYESVLSSKGYSAQCVPVLDTIHANLDRLCDIILDAKNRGIQGVVITSKRSCESLSEAILSLSKNSSGSSLFSALEHLSHIPIYVVGESTASAVREVQRFFQDLGFSSARTLGEASGTGEQLGHFIVHHHAATPANAAKKLLYLTGDKNRDTVASILTENDVPFLALRVYETHQRPDFEALLSQAVESLQNSSSQNEWWAAYFAPSTASFALPAAQRLLESRGMSLRTSTIGPVTTTFVGKTFNVKVEATALRPDAVALADAMLAYDLAHDRLE